MTRAAARKNLLRPQILILALVCLASLSATHAYSQAESERRTETELLKLQNIGEFWEASKNEKTSHLTHSYEFDITVLYYDPHWHLLWIANKGHSTGFFPILKKPFPFENGQVLTIKGELIPSEGLDPDKMEIARASTSVELPTKELSNVLSEAREQNFQWVSVHAFVDEQTQVDPQHIDFELIRGSQRIKAHLLVDPDRKIPNLTRTFVHFKGLLVTEPNYENPLGSLVLWSSDQNHISQSQQKRADSFESQAIPIQELRDHATNEWVRIEGTVQSFERGQHLSLSDPTGYIQVIPNQTLQLNIGDKIEVLGSPLENDNGWTLANALYRPITDFDLQGSMRGVTSENKYHIRLASEILQLDSLQAIQQQTAKLSGVITYSDPEKRYFYLNDLSGGIRVQLEEPWPDAIPAGNFAYVDGHVSPGGFAPFITAEKLRITGPSKMPDSKLVTLPQALTGIEEGRWIEMKANLYGMETEGRTTILKLSSPTGEFTALLPLSHQQLEINKGSTISVKGVCVASDRENNQLPGVSILVPNTSRITIIDTAPKDPFSYNPTPIPNILRYRSMKTAAKQVLIRGTVLLHIPGKSIFISDGEHTVRALLDSDTPTQPGDIVDIVGLPGRSGNHFVLRNSMLKKVESGTPPKPTVISQDSPLEKSRYAQLVQYKGRLIDSEQNDEQTRLVVQLNGYLTEVLFPNSPKTESQKWQNGSQLQVSGLYFNEADEYSSSKSITILARNPSDIQVLQLPSWWNQQRALAVSGGSALALVLGIAWVTTLKRRVKKQTSLIRQQVDKEKQLIEAATDFIFTLDLQGNFTSFNSTCESITGFSRDEIKTMLVYDLLNKADAKLARLALTRRKTKAETKSLQSEIIRKDGSKLWVETSLRFLRTEGKVTGMFCIMRDITLRKKVHQELTRARDAAESNTKAKSAFLATMSHELRTPMNGVISMANILLDTDLDETQRDYTSTIRDSGESLLTLLNDILDLSKAEAGKLSIEPFELDLKELLNQSVSLLSTTAQQKNIQLETNVTDDTPTLLIGDAGRIKQVILNLTGNAIKFTEDGHVKINVSKLEDTNKHVNIRIEIEDTGVGISETAASRLFRPFEQADGSHSRRFGGTGLGLAISKEIVELMDGEIGVDSVLGKGSTFWFTLKLEKVDIDAQQQTLISKSKEKSAKKSQRWKGPPLKILIAEDLPINQRVTRLQLKKIGLTADLAENGVEVLDAVRSKRYDVILMDCQMPVMDGYQATKKLRAVPEHSDIHIVALTANAMEGDKERCFAAGMNDFVSKPTRPDTLLTAFENFAKVGRN
ncbi:PAS fold family [Verrucomicrobiia bacterium DG1235]|nr:PAS fold family [Verrucomicrobiae bacterium DG1235]